MNTYLLEPVDTLFFKDARPMQAEAGSGGHGANWPLPTVVHEALRANLLRMAGEDPRGSRIAHHKTGRNGKREKLVVSDSFRSLRTKGPFPLRKDRLYVPTPRDLVTSDQDKRVLLLAPLKEPDGTSDLAGMNSWLKPLVSRAGPAKTVQPSWVPMDWFRQYLATAEGLECPPSDDALFDAECRIGVELDDDKLSAAEGKLYSAEHLRLRPDVRLWVQATLSERDGAHNPVGVTLQNCVDGCVTLGGESRMCRVRAGVEGSLLDIPEPTGLLVKWVLVSHAVFLNGWLPDWIDSATGDVMLPGGDTARCGAPRKEWRERVRKIPHVKAKLVAACVSKPLVFSGWDAGWERTGADGRAVRGGPKPTILAAPAGSAYYFKAETDEDARYLVKALHGRTRSDCFGEKGMGLGFCGTWKWA